MPPDISNPIPADEIEAWLRVVATGLLGNPYDGDFARRVDRWRRSWLPERAWGVQEHGRWVAALATKPLAITIPGTDGGTREVVADALTSVAVAGTHRRQGILTAMISQSLAAAKARGDLFSILVAAEWPIYGRFGYAPAVWSADYVYRPRVSPVGALAPGRVRQVDPEELLAHAPAIYEGFRSQRPGQVQRRRDWWARRLGLDGYEPMSNERSHWFLHDGPAGPDGLLSWKVTRDFELDGRLGAIVVEDLVATNSAAYQDLLAYLAGIDVIDEITLPNLAVDEELRWLLRDGRALKQNYAGDWIWLRLLDVPAALAARGYAVPGRLVIEVLDEDLGGYGAGRFVLTADGDAAECTPTDEPAQLRVSQRVLATAYLGGATLRSLRLTGGVEELAPGALGLADAMLRTPLAPANATPF